jgi:Domain of unknown function (DUF4340)
LNARITGILVILLAMLGGGALLYQSREAARRPANAAAMGQKVFPDLKAADVASIRIVEPKATLTLQRSDQGWVVAERGGFPADLAKVREFVLKAIELKVGQSEPIGDKDRARLNLDGSGTQVELNGADGKPLGKLVVGRKYFRREVENPDRVPADGRFIMRADNPATVYIVSEPFVQASARSAAWIDRGAFKIEKVKTLELRYPDGSGWRIERGADNADWMLAGVKPGEKLDIGRANAASYSLGLLELADVAPGDAKDTGLDTPTLINASTLAGLSYAIKVGKAEGESYYVSFTSSSEEPRDKLLARHVLRIPKSKLEDTLKKRADFLERKEDTKK